MIDSPKYRLLQLTKDRVPQAAKILTNSFLHHNKLQMGKNIDFPKVQKYMNDKTLQMLEWQNELRQNGTIGKDTYLNFIFVDENDKIVLVSTNIELMQYLSKKSKYSLENFQNVMNYAGQLEKSIDPKDKVPGRSVLNVYAAADYKIPGQGLLMSSTIRSAQYLYSQGFRFLYGRTWNSITYDFLSKYGGQVLSEVDFRENEQKVTLSMSKTDNQKFKYNQAMPEYAGFKPKL